MPVEPLATPPTSPAPLASRHLAETLSANKPRLRGWLHAGSFPVVLVAGVVLVVLAPTDGSRAAAAVFAASAALLFGTSALYHRLPWAAAAHGRLKRLDHSNIFLLIAGTATPLAVTMLAAGTARVLLTVVWAGAVAGVLFRVFWVGAPRWLYVPLYVLLGWASVGYVGEYARVGGWLVAALVLAGGVLYTAGAVVYGTKRPDPAPRWFGFHEIFHACTVVAFALHYAAVSIATYAVA
ncbi:PAQR family membrane homeostasis protein TrhA [Kineococcus rubinsiae]|uniref:PAQR family membrane homeostasis protein TrhA n=1 Tax=Kineococcus rubinsiae TaxID=2609562 RepID=UPI0014312743|nr:hemolysin III family protein [Kineococcus rubinsiae]NIZ91311.1 hemolysin III family protein [Kineococcus rubinsiae]